MSMNTRRTPGPRLPLEAKNIDANHQCIYDADGNNVGHSFITETGQADFIVSACNAHDDLVAALRICLKAENERRKKLLPGAPATTYTEARIAKIEAALAKAGAA